MIITRSPLRISLGGGGTDLPSRPKTSKQNRFFHSVQLACNQATWPR